MDLPGRDSVRDFLARDGALVQLYESSGVDTEVTDQSAGAQAVAWEESRMEIIAPATSGFMFVELPDPYLGRKQVVSARRGDGKSLRTANVWFSRKRERHQQTDDHYVNLFDANGGGSYSIEVEDNVLYPHPPVIQFIADRTTHEGARIGFLVEASDPNQTRPVLSAEPLPSGATFTDESTGTLAVAAFDWSPAVGQAGSHAITFFARDDIHEVSRTATITVCPGADTDCDDLPDSWEFARFGSLGRDGTGDFDGDGATDAEEYERGTDPTVIDVPGRPVIIEPLDGVSVAQAQPLLLVENGRHRQDLAVLYTFEMFSDEGLTEYLTGAVVAEQEETTGWTVDTPLEENHWYWWRARTCDPDLCSEWANARFQVNVSNEAPGAFHIASPAPLSDVGVLRPLLTVTNSADPDGDELTYRFKVFDMDLPDQVLAAAVGIPAGGAGNTGWTVDVDLEEDRWYGWQVIAVDGGGLERTMEELGSFFVDTVNTPPSQPEIFAPAEGAEAAAQDLRLAVVNAIDPDDAGLDYFFELDLLATFDGPGRLVSGAIRGDPSGVTGWTVTGLADNTLYHWRVKASDGTAESAWRVASFRVNLANEPPGAPTVRNPGDRAWVGTRRPVLSLNPARDPDGEEPRYAFELYRDAAMTDLASVVDGHGPDWTVDFDLDDNTWYYWRAQAVDGAGARGDWTALHAFFVNENDLDDPPEITLIAPASDVTVGETLLIVWDDLDPDSNATIALYFEPADGTGAAAPIVAGLAEDPDGGADSYLWDVGSVQPGDYRIFALVEDASGSVTGYAPGVVTVSAAQGRIEVVRVTQPDTTEAGVSVQLAVTLGSAPGAPVTVPVASTDATEGVATPATLVFDASNWSVPQTVTVQGVNDCGQDGDVVYHVRFGPSSSADPAYSGVSADEVDIVNRDNDPIGTHPTLQVCNYVLVRTTRAGRVDYDYTFRVDLTNTGAAFSNVSATVASLDANTRVIDATVTFGSVDAGATVVSTDTFTIRQNRQYAFDPAALEWGMDAQP